MQYIACLGNSEIMAMLTQRIILVAIWLFFLYLINKKNKPTFLLWAVIILGSLSIIFDMSFMKSSYGLHEGGNADRHAYLAQVMTYFVGNPFNEDYGVKGAPAMMSPFFPYAVAVLSKITGIAISRIYDYSSLLWTILLPLSFYFFGAPLLEHSQKAERRWIGGLMACFALYLSSDPMDLRFFREDFWNCLVLLKPDHSISFCLVPVFYYFMQKRISFINTILGGLALGLMTLTWPVIGAFIIWGLAIYLILILVWQKKVFWKVLFQVMGTVIITIIVSSYWWSNFLFFKDVPGGPSDSCLTLLKFNNIVFDPLESAFFMLPLFITGLVGIYFMFRRRSRGDLILLGFILAMYICKFTIYPFLIYFFKFGPQAFENSVFMIRFSMGIASGIGIYELARRLPEILNKKILERIFPKAVTAGAMVSLSLLLLTPYLVPVWQVPVLNSKWYAGARPINPQLLSFADWIKKNTGHNSVFLGDGPTSLWIATLTGRKIVRENQGNRNFVLNFPRRLADAKIIYESKRIDEETLSLLKKYDIGYIVVHSRVLNEFPDAYCHKFEQNYGLFEMVYNANGFTVFKVLKKN